jgi:hypothetical protein
MKVYVVFVLFYLQFMQAMEDQRPKLSMRQIAFFNNFLSFDKYKESYLRNTVDSVLAGNPNQELERLRSYYIKRAAECESKKAGSVIELQGLKSKYENEHNEKISQIKKYHDRSMLHSFSGGVLVGCALTTIFFLKK